MITWIDKVVSKLPLYAIDQIDNANGLRNSLLGLNLVTAIAILVATYNKTDIADQISDEYTVTFGGSMPEIAKHVAFNLAERKILNNHGIKKEFKLDTLYGGYDTVLFNKMMFAGSVLVGDAHTYVEYEQKVLADGLVQEEVQEIIKVVAILNSLTKFADFLEYSMFSM